MTDRNGLALLSGVVASAVVGLMASATLARPISAADASSFSLESTVAAAIEPDQPDGLLQTEMKDHGWGGNMLDQYGLKLTGYGEVGWNFNFDRPLGGENAQYNLFDDKSDDPTIDQLSLILSREAFASTDRFDTGFKLQVIYGSDARFTQANGTNFYGHGYANRQIPLAPPNDKILVITPGQTYPENEIDVLQAYLTVNVPVGNGLMLTMGKFVRPWGEETVDPTKNLFYTHSYMFGVEEPITLTGVMGDYRIDDTWRVKGGVVVGWDQSLEDDNSFPSFFAQVGYKVSEDLDTAVTVMGGPEQPENRSNWRWLLDGTADYKIDTDWTLSAEALVGYDEDTTTTLHGDGSRQFLFGDGAWWGAAVYSSYRIDDAGMYVLQARGEFFDDNKGMRQLITEVYSGTLGVNIRPFVNDRIGKNFVIRPEIRWDWALDSVFDNFTRDQQIIASIDAIFQF